MNLHFVKIDFPSEIDRGRRVVNDVRRLVDDFSLQSFLLLLLLPRGRTGKKRQPGLLRLLRACARHGGGGGGGGGGNTTNLYWFFLSITKLFNLIGSNFAMTDFLFSPLCFSKYVTTPRLSSELTINVRFLSAFYRE